MSAPEVLERSGRCDFCGDRGPLLEEFRLDGPAGLVSWIVCPTGAETLESIYKTD